MGAFPTLSMVLTLSIYALTEGNDGICLCPTVDNNLSNQSCRFSWLVKLRLQSVKCSYHSCPSV